MSAVRKLTEQVSHTAQAFAAEISAALGDDRPAGSPAASSRPQLRVVSPLRPATASRGMFITIVAVLLGLGMIVMLLINTQLASGAFTVATLQQQKAVLDEQAAVLTESVAAASAPDALEQSARELGMVPSETPVFIRVPDGTVLGKPRPAKAQPVPVVPMEADATAVEAVDAGAGAVPGADLPAGLPEGYDPAAADAAAGAAGNAAAATGEDALWGEVAVDLGPLGSSDADLTAVPVGR